MQLGRDEIGANLGYRMILVPDACDCFDLPDEDGGTVPAETIRRAHVATLAFEFASIASTEAVSAMIGADAMGDAG